MYSVSLKSSKDENGDTVYTVGEAKYYKVTQVVPMPGSIQETLSGIAVHECNMDIYVATDNGTLWNYYDEVEDGTVDIPIPIRGDSQMVVINAVPEAATDEMNIERVPQDESNIFVSWNVPRSTTWASPNLEVRYAGKPSSFDGSSYHDVAAGLEYHGPDYRLRGKFSLLPSDSKEEDEEDGSGEQVIGVPSSSPSAAAMTAPSSEDESSAS